MPSTILRCATATLVALVLVVLVAPAEADPRRNEETWNSIRPDLFDDVAIADGAHLLTLEAPYRAHDAAVVPITVKAAADSGIDKITLVIDENPAPLAAAIEFGPAAASPTFITRVRVNAYSYVRAIARTRRRRSVPMARPSRSRSGAASTWCCSSGPASSPQRPSPSTASPTPSPWPGRCD